MTSALYGGVGGQHYTAAALPPGKTRYPLYSRQAGPQGRSGRMRKISPPPVFDPRTVQPRSKSLYRLSYPGQHKWVPGIYHGGKGGRCVELTNLPPSSADCLWHLETSTSWNTHGLSRPVKALFYLTLYTAWHYGQRTWFKLSEPHEFVANQFCVFQPLQ